MMLYNCQLSANCVTELAQEVLSKRKTSKAMNKANKVRRTRVVRRQIWFCQLCGCVLRSLILVCLLVSTSQFLSLPASAQRVAPQLTEENEKSEPRRVTLRFVTTSEFPPFNFYDEDGVLTGFNVDLARAICLEFRTACDIRVQPWEQVLESIERGQADAAIAAHSVTPQALLRVNFTTPYFHTPGRFTGRRELGKIEATPAGVQGRRIGVVAGTTHEAFLKDFFRTSRIKSYRNAETCRDALMDGKLDLIFDDAISLAFWLNGTLSKRCCEFKGGPYLEPKYFGDGIAIAVSKGDEKLLGELNAALRRVRASGRFRELVTRYFPFQLY